jgi:hypothetical protein
VAVSSATASGFIEFDVNERYSDLDEAAGAADATACSRSGSCERLK